MSAHQRGTTTTHVQKSGVLVYAPRAARAQKVVFDTADKQMIHESDTPFRKFFNSHSDDFAPGKVNYAKTTILNDIVSRLNNKEYIRLMVHDIIEQHKDSAIAPFSQIEEELNSTLMQLGFARNELKIIADGISTSNLADLNKIKEKTELTMHRAEILKSTLEGSNEYAKLVKKEVDGKVEVVSTINQADKLGKIVKDVKEKKGLYDLLAETQKALREEYKKLKLEEKFKGLKDKHIENKQKFEISNITNKSAILNEFAKVDSKFIALNESANKLKTEVNKNYPDLSKIANMVKVNEGINYAMDSLKDELVVLHSFLTPPAITDAQRKLILVSTKPILSDLGDIAKEIDNLEKFVTNNLNNSSKDSKINVKAKSILDGLNNKMIDLENSLQLTQHRVSKTGTQPFSHTLLGKLYIVREKKAELEKNIENFKKEACKKTIKHREIINKAHELSESTTRLITPLLGWNNFIENYKIVFTRVDVLLTTLITNISKNLEEVRTGADTKSNNIKNKTVNLLAEFDASSYDFGDKTTFEIIDSKIVSSNSTAEKKRDQNVRLLTDAIYHALLQENYPYIREDDIERVIKKFYCSDTDIDCKKSIKDIKNPIDRQYREIWETTTLPDTSVGGVKTLALDLKESLRERRFFKLIINEAVANRLNLFRSADSALKPMKNANDVLKEFVDKNITNLYAEHFVNNEDSMWLSFLKNNKEMFQYLVKLPERTKIFCR